MDAGLSAFCIFAKLTPRPRCNSLSPHANAVPRPSENTNITASIRRISGHLRYCLWRIFDKRGIKVAHVVRVVNLPHLPRIECWGTCASATPPAVIDRRDSRYQRYPRPVTAALAEAGG